MQTVTAGVAVARDNPYWDAVAAYAHDDRTFGWSVDGWRTSPGPTRHDLVRQFAWSITDPQAVAFVAAHAGPKLVDPLAGTGYWCHLLRQCGVDALAYDVAPPDGSDVNGWHKGATTFGPVLAGDAAQVAAAHGNRTLLLSWPPYDHPIGVETLRAYTGARVIYIGEGDGGCCGDDDMFAELAAAWTQVADHRLIQWGGMHDWITIYDRKGGERL